MKIVKWILFFTVALVIIFVIAKVGFRWGYYKELNQIKKDLTKIHGVKVLNIWGHEDLTLEEISARIQIKGKGEIVLNNLNKDDNSYPQNVFITEIGGYSFENISCDCLSSSIGIGSFIDIGSESYLGKLLNLSFRRPENIIQHYDRIYSLIDSIAKVANPIHIYPDSNELTMMSSETFIFLTNNRSKDQDPIFNLVGIKSKFEAGRRLPWKTENCSKENL